MDNLLPYEKKFLSLHHSIKKFNLLSKEMSNYKKNDILWSLYNDLLLSYQFKKDWFNCFLTYQQMSTQLYNEQKYKEALQFLILALYIRIYDIAQYCIDNEPSNAQMLYERHISKHHRDLKKYMKSANIEILTTDDMCSFIRKIIDYYLPMLKDDFWIYWLSFKYIDYIQNKSED